MQVGLSDGTEMLDWGGVVVFTAAYFVNYFLLVYTHTLCIFLALASLPPRPSLASDVIPTPFQYCRDHKAAPILNALMEYRPA